MIENIKIIASDLDGTLLTTDKEISDYSKKVINDFLDCGGVFVPCTGRAYTAIHEWLRNHPKIRYYISTNGAVIYDKTLAKPLKKFVIPFEIAKEIYDLLRCECSYELIVDGTMYTEELIDIYEYHVEQYFKYHYYQTRNKKENLFNWIVENNLEIEKVHIIFKYVEDLERVEKLLNERGGLNVHSGAGRFLEISTDEASKGDALKYLADLLAVKSDELVCFGDQNNDCSMFENFKYAVAVDNANPTIKEIANYHTDNNDEDGVAKFMEKCF